jgi:hypothetical protein
MAEPEWARPERRLAAVRQAAQRLWKDRVLPRGWAVVVDSGGQPVWAVKEAAAAELELGAQDVRAAQAALHDQRQSWDARAQREAVVWDPPAELLNPLD